MLPIGEVVVYNIRASIVNSDRMWGHVQRSWPNTEKVEGSSRGSPNPGSSTNVGSSVNVGTLFLGKLGEKASRTRSSLFRRCRLSNELDHTKTDDHCFPCYQPDTWVLPHHEMSCRSTV